ncbi:MAG: RNA polymerase sigma factor [Proteobacteria bacterium]|nr:RNA polymerase sigma factor [Pseudomonadota bacterium]
MRDSDVLDKNPHISRSALEAIHDQVFGWALSRCNYDRAAAEDLVQQSYVELLAGKAKFEERSTLKTFVFAVIQNLAKSRYRRMASRMRLVTAMAQDAGDEPAAETTAVENPAVWQAVQRLPQRQRDIIELVFCRDMTVEDASRVMGVTTGTGRVHYDRAKKTLRARLEDGRESNDE